MPLIVYLDTQDYINLFNEPEDGPNNKVMVNLLAHRDRGEIIMGFSFATIMEFITKPDATNRSERVRRGQLIKDICGSNAFPYISDLARGAKFPNGGKWMFSNDENVVSAKSFKRYMHKALMDELAKAEGLNRQQRRKFGGKGGLATLISCSGSTWGRKRSDYGNFPVSDEIVESRILERFMKGQCSDSEFETRMNAWLSDPAEFSRIAYDYADKPNMIEATFGKSTDDIERMVKTHQSAVNEVQRLNVKRLNVRSNLVDMGIGKSKAREQTKQFPLPIPDPNTPNTKLEALFGKGRAGHFNHYLTQVMKPGYSFKRSDVMDVMQMCYAYDCNLFRCDKAMANTFRNYKPFKGKLVGRFAELPDCIARLLESPSLG